MDKRESVSPVSTDMFIDAPMSDAEERECNDMITSGINQRLENRREEHLTTTNFQTLMHLLKGNIGTGVFAMAAAVKHAGLATGLVATFALGTLCIHCMHILVDCSHILCKKEEKPALDYGEVVEAAFKHSPFHKRAKLARAVVQFYLVVSQIGFCCVYIVYVATTLERVISLWSGVDLPYRAYTAMILLPLIFLCFIRSLKVLAPFSTAANVVLCAALIVVFQYVFRNMQPAQSLPQFAGWSKLPLFFGTAIYAFEGIGIILPIENRMKNPKDFSGLTGILNVGMILIMVLYSSAGFFGYLAFGDAVEDTIMLSLPQEGIYIFSALCVGVVIFFSYPLQFYVPFEILWPWVKARLTNEKHQKYGEYIFRAAFVIFTFIFAVAISQLELFISLVGAIGSTFLALIMPPILEVVTLGKDNLGFWNWRLFKNILIFLFGVFGSVLGTYISIEEIVKSFSS